MALAPVRVGLTASGARGACRARGPWHTLRRAPARAAAAAAGPGAISDAPDAAGTPDQAAGGALKSFAAPAAMLADAAWAAPRTAARRGAAAGEHRRRVAAAGTKKYQVRGRFRRLTN